MIKEFEKIDIVNTILTFPPEMLPSFLNVHPALDKRIHDILKNDPEPISPIRKSRSLHHRRIGSHFVHGHSIETLIVTKEEIDNNDGGAGLEIRIPDFKGNPQSPDDGQIFIEYYEDKIQVRGTGRMIL